jgi:hypothetical protein
MGRSEAMTNTAQKIAAHTPEIACMPYALYGNEPCHYVVHRLGTVLSVHRTEEQARAALAAAVKS